MFPCEAQGKQTLFGRLARTISHRSIDTKQTDEKTECKGSLQGLDIEALQRVIGRYELTNMLEPVPYHML